MNGEKLIHITNISTQMRRRPSLHAFQSNSFSNFTATNYEEVNNYRVCIYLSIYIWKENIQESGWEHFLKNTSFPNQNMLSVEVTEIWHFPVSHKKKTQHLTAKILHGLIWQSMRHLLMIIAFKCFCFHAALTFALLLNSYAHRETSFRSSMMQKKNIWTESVSDELSSSPLWTEVTLTFLTPADPSTHSSIWEQLVKFLVLPFLHPLHFHAFRSLSFPLSPYHLASHLRQDTGGPLPGPDLYLPKFPLALLPLLSICALVCALRLSVHIRTETHPDSYLSCSLQNTQRETASKWYSLSLVSFSASLPLSFPQCPSDVGVSVHIYSLWFHSSVPAGERMYKPYINSSESERQGEIAPNSSTLKNTYLWDVAGPSIFSGT